MELKSQTDREFRTFGRFYGNCLTRGHRFQGADFDQFIHWLQRHRGKNLEFVVFYTRLTGRNVHYDELIFVLVF